MGIVLLVVGLAIAMKIGIGLFIYTQMKADERRKAREKKEDSHA